MSVINVLSAILVILGCWVIWVWADGIENNNPPMPVSAESPDIVRLNFPGNVANVHVVEFSDKLNHHCVVVSSTSGSLALSCEGH